MGTRDLKGIKGFLNDLQMGKAISPSIVVPERNENKLKEADNSVTHSTSLKRSGKSKKVARTETKDPTIASSGRRVTPQGRPRGRKDGEGKRKIKVSVLVDAELWEQYHDRVWEERCQLGELVERALRAYQRESWSLDT